MDSAEAGHRSVTTMLREWSDGNKEVLDELIPIVQGQLRHQARRYLRRERRDHSLQTTELINEAYIRLVEGKCRKWKDRRHFFAVAARAMRSILVDHARTKKRLKRGGNAVRLGIEVEEVPDAPRSVVDVIALDEALLKLSEIDPRLVRIIELRYFGGLTTEEAGKALGISRATVCREWEFGKAWLGRELSKKG